MVPLIVVIVYLAVTLYIGSIAFRKTANNTEDFFLANRTIGPMVFFMSLFATNMTAFAILGSSGLAFRRGIGVYGLMASSSGFVIPLTIYLIGTRLWSLGKRFGHMTQVHFFRDRWECSAIGTCIFGLSVAMLVPYMIISIMGGGRVLHDISSKKDADGKIIMTQVMEDGKPVMVKQPVPVKGADGKPVIVPVIIDGAPVIKDDGTPAMQAKLEFKDVPKMEPECYLSYELGALIVAIAVTSIVFFGGMRGTVWVNIFQTLLFLLFGTIAVFVIGKNLPNGFGAYFKTMADDPLKSFFVDRERMSRREFFSYTLIPLSSIMFPHMSIMCLSARKVSAFKRTVVLYPLAIMAIWLPCIFLGVIASQTVKGVAPGAEDGVLLMMLNQYAPPLLAGILGAGIISAVMGSDCHQVLAISTMFTKDLFHYYGGQKRFGEKGGVWFARAFIVLLTIVAYAVALSTSTHIFELAIRFAFSGFAAMAPVMLAALFWKRSTKYGALASTFFVAASLVFFGVLQHYFKAGDPIIVTGTGPNAIQWLIASAPTGDIRILGFMTVVPMVIGSAVCMVIGSLLTKPPSQATIDRYFSRTLPGTPVSAAPAVVPAAVRVS